MNKTAKYTGYSTEDSHLVYKDDRICQKPRYSIHADLEPAAEYYKRKARKWFQDNHMGNVLPKDLYGLVDSKAYKDHQNNLNKLNRQMVDWLYERDI